MHPRRWSTVAASAVAVCLVAPAAQAQVRYVNLTSTPPGATVYIDEASGNPVGQTPLRRVRTTRGVHRFIFERQGYVRTSLEATINTNNRTITATLVQAGNIYVAADVDGAHIFLNGNEVGTTPGRINNVTPGQHIVEVRQEGREPVRESVTVVPGGLATVNVSLRPTVAPTGTVRVIVTNPNGPVPAGLQVTLDGAPLTGTPPASDQVQPGTHIINVAAPGFRSTRREVTITAGQVQAIAVDLEAAAATGGTVRIVAPVAGARAFIDGEAVSLTDGRGEAANVGVGQHSVRVEAEGRASVRRDVNVAAGQQVVVEVGESDMPVAQARGQVQVTATPPEAEIFINSERVGQGRVEREVNAGAATIMVRAEGYQEFTQECQVAPGTPCVVRATLQRPQAMGNLVVQTSVPGAQVFVGDDPSPHPVGAVGSFPAGAVRVRVTAPGYDTWEQNVSLSAGDNPPVMARLGRDSTIVNTARRRAQLSTIGAAPLALGDGAVDASIGIGGMPLEARATFGLLPEGLRTFGIDAGIGLRTRFDWLEMEARARIGLRLADGVFAVGGEARLYGAFGAKSSSGWGAVFQGNASVRLSTGEDRAGFAGAFILTLNGGVEINSDSPGRMNLDYTIDSVARPLCTGFVDGECQAPNTVRGFLGLGAEAALWRHLSFWGLATLYIPFPGDVGYDAATNTFSNVDDVTRRPLTTDFWAFAIPINFRLGVTYKF
ncbi:MAG: PEGA domain-containing protein [Polyangiales bacterium]